MRQNAGKRLLLALVLLGLGLAWQGLAAPLSDLSIAGGPCLPWRFSSLELRSEAGILGRVEVRGLAWDGSSRLLYREDVEAWTSSLAFKVYIDEDLRFLEARAEGPGGLKTASLEVDEAKGAVEPGETKRRARLRALVPPFVKGLEGPLPARLDLPPSLLEAAGRNLAGRLPLRPAPLASLAVLGLFVLGASLASGLGPRRRGGQKLGRPGLVLPILACIATASLALSLQNPKARLILVDLPLPDSQGLVAGPLEAQGAGNFDPRVKHYATPNHGGGPSLVLLSTPGDSGLALEDLVREGDELVLSEPPLVVGSRGGFELRAGRPLSGWRVHGQP